MKDQLSRWKVVETELAKPLLDALLRVAQGSRWAGPERSDTAAEKVGPQTVQTVVLPGDDQQRQPMSDERWGEDVGGGGRTGLPALSEFLGHVSRLRWTGSALSSVSGETGQEGNMADFPFCLVWDLLRITPGTTKVCYLI